MNERNLRRRCRQELRALDIYPPLNVDMLCQRLGKRSGRVIRFVPWSLPVPGPLGLWLATKTRDYIVYQAETTPKHQDHIILHEVGHILADHLSDDVDGEYWNDALPGLSPGDMIQRALRRTCYTDLKEHEAELIATIMMEWAAVLDYVTPHRSDQEAVRRIQAAFNDHLGWL